jgi:hypothetical protein
VRELRQVAERFLADLQLLRAPDAVAVEQKDAAGGGRRAAAGSRWFVVLGSAAADGDAGGVDGQGPGAGEQVVQEANDDG